MKLTVDLTGAGLRDELELLHDARRAVSDLLLPDLDLNRAGKDRLGTLLGILDALFEAAWRQGQDPSP